MRVATRLRLSLAFFTAVLAAVVVMHGVSMRQTVNGTRALSAIATRQRAVADQLRRLDDLGASLRKYGVTGAREYLERAAVLAGAHEGALRSLLLQSLTPSEDGAGRDLALRWTPVSRAIDSAVIEGRLHAPWRPGGVSPELALEVRRVADAIDALRMPTEALASASGMAMLDELRAADDRAASSARLFWIIAIVAALLAGILSTLLARSILVPLERLARATRDVAQGRFGPPVKPTGDDELASLGRDFNDMSAHLEELDRMKRDFISNVSHDLKSPLAAMQETNDVLLDGLAGPLAARQRHLLEMSRDTGRRLAAMIHKLLDLARLDARPTPVRAMLDLAALTQRAVDHMNATRLARGRGPVVVLARAPAHLLLRADAEEIAQVLDNLLENAVKFSPEESVVRVTVEERDGDAVLRVADNGPGVPAAEKRRIFERFHQTEAGRAAPDHGVGLGLAICRHIVEAHGGVIAVLDNSPSGAVFEVLMPGAIAVPAPSVAPRLAETCA